MGDDDVWVSSSFERGDQLFLSGERVEWWGQLGDVDERGGLVVGR